MHIESHPIRKKIGDSLAGSVSELLILMLSSVAVAAICGFTQSQQIDRW